MKQATLSLRGALPPRDVFSFITPLHLAAVKLGVPEEEILAVFAENEELTEGDFKITFDSTSRRIHFTRPQPVAEVPTPAPARPVQAPAPPPTQKPVTARIEVQQTVPQTKAVEVPRKHPLAAVVSSSLNDLVKSRTDFLFVGTPQELFAQLRKPTAYESWPATAEEFNAALAHAHTPGIRIAINQNGLTLIWRAHKEKSPEDVAELARVHQAVEERAGRHITISAAVQHVRARFGITD